MEYSEPPPRNRVRLIVTSEYSMSSSPSVLSIHLGAPQRRAPRCPRENHVRHLPATQSASTLLAHDPGERVDDVRFTRPVGADDARNARLKGKHGRTGEGLKAPQRQVFEVHPCRLAVTQ